MATRQLTLFSKRFTLNLVFVVSLREIALQPPLRAASHPRRRSLFSAPDHSALGAGTITVYTVGCAQPVSS